MQKKEFYKHRLPHFQQPGQAYFVTWCLNAAVPPKALERYTKELELLRHQIDAVPGAAIGCGDLANAYLRLQSPLNYSRLKIATPDTPNAEFEKLKKAYYLVRKKYIKAYDDLLDSVKKPVIDLSKSANREILFQTLLFWEGKKIKNIAFTIMPNHVHWVVELMNTDENGNPVYLQDVLRSVKRQSSRQINIKENREGKLWQKESFDTTIRDERHLYYAIRYTLNNPVNAGLVNDWKKWEGTWCRPGCGVGCGVGCGDF
ncbi:MAG: transposase [Prolixibacteraceae bacterium]